MSKETRPLIAALLFLISLNSWAQVNWVSGGFDALSPNTIRFHCLDGWFKLGENVDGRLGLGGASIISNPNPNHYQSAIEFWHLGPAGLSYGLGNGFSIEGSLEVMFGPIWNKAFLVDDEDIGWVPGIRSASTSRQLALSKMIPVEDWGCLSLRVGLRACGGIDVYGKEDYLNNDIVWVRDYLGRLEPYSTGFFAQAVFGVGDWRGYRWNKTRTPRALRPKPQKPSSRPAKTTRNSESTSSKQKTKGQVSFTEGSLDLNVKNVFVIQGKGQSCSSNSVESGLLDVVGTQLLSSYSVLERQMLDVILEEQRLSMSGLVFEATAVEAGCLQGADGVVFCQYGCLGEDDLLTIKLVDCKTSSQIWVLSAINTPPLEAIQQLSRELK